MIKKRGENEDRGKKGQKEVRGGKKKKGRKETFLKYTADEILYFESDITLENGFAFKKA